MARANLSSLINRSFNLNGKHRLHLDHHQPNRHRNGPIFQTENVKLDRTGVVDFRYDSIFDWHLCCLDSSRAFMVVGDGSADGDYGVWCGGVD